MIDRLSGGPEGTYDLLYEYKVMTVIIIIISYKKYLKNLNFS